MGAGVVLREQQYLAEKSGDDPDELNRVSGRDLRGRRAMPATADPNEPRAIDWSPHPAGTMTSLSANPQQIGRARRGIISDGLTQNNGRPFVNRA